MERIGCTANLARLCTEYRFTALFEFRGFPCLVHLTFVSELNGGVSLYTEELPEMRCSCCCRVKSAEPKQ